MQTKAMSTGFSLARACASVTWSARTGTVNSGSFMACVTRKPCFCMCSTWAGHGSMKVTSSPFLHHMGAGIAADRTRTDKGNLFAHTTFLPDIPVAQRSARGSRM